MMGSSSNAVFIHHFHDLRRKIMVFVRLFQLLLLCTRITKSFSQSVMMVTCQMVIDERFQPTFPSSFLASYQIQPSFSRLTTDCAYLCLTSNDCYTAVLEVNTKSCTMYRENAAYSGQLVTDSIGIFTTIISGRIPSESFLTVISCFTISF